MTLVRENFNSGYIDTAAPEKRGVLRSGWVHQPWETEDAWASYKLAQRLISLRIGARRFSTISEMYFQESHGVIP